MSLFAGMARQAAALPPIQEQAAPQRGRGLFGGGQRPDVNSILTFLTQGTNGLDRNRANAAAAAAAQLAASQRAQRDQYAATIQDPIERQVFMTAPDQWAQNAAKRFAPETLAAGSVQVLNGRPVAGAPQVQRFDDRFGSFDPITQQTTYSAPRGMTEAEITTRQQGLANLDIARQNADTSRIVAERPQITTLAPGVQAFGVTPDGQTAPLAENSNARPMSDADQAAVQRADLAVTQSTLAIDRASRIADDIAQGRLNLGPMTNLIGSGRNLTGNSSDNSRGLADLQQWAKQARDAILSANTGVQTDQDAVRALDNVLANINDERLVGQYLDQFVTATTATRDVFQRDIARRSAQYQGQAQTPQGGQGGQMDRSALEAEARRRGLIR